MSVVFCSCGAVQQYQQIVTVSDRNGAIPDNGIHHVDSNDVEVAFDFWESGGRANIIINNSSEQDVAIDLSRTFLVINGFAKDYRESGTSADNLIWVPSGCKRIVDGPELMSLPYRRCGLKRNPRRNGEEQYFTLLNSPLVFKVIVRLIGDNAENIVSSDFYISSLFNSSETYVLEKDTIQKCDARAMPTTIIFNKFQVPYRFYIPYTISSAYDTDR